MALEAGTEEFHLVSKDTPVGEREEFCPVGYVRHCQQRHPGLLRGLAALAGIARTAGRDDVGPHIKTAAGQGDDMVARQLAIAERFPAVHAEKGIPPEKFVVRERWQRARKGGPAA